IQFKNLKDGWSAFSSINFQIKLYEGSNKIEFVYGSFIADSYPNDIYVVIGIKGITFSRSVNATKSNNQSWDQTQFVNGYDGSYFDDDFANAYNILPSTGTTFQFNTNPLKF